MKYIDADKLIAEINRQKIGYNLDGEHYAEYNTWRKIIDIIDSLQQEQPEVDLEKEIHTQAIKLHTAPCYEELANFARHFYSLGLNARKEE